LSTRASFLAQLLDGLPHHLHQGAVRRQTAAATSLDHECARIPQPALGIRQESGFTNAESPVTRTNTPLPWLACSWQADRAVSSRSRPEAATRRGGGKDLSDCFGFRMPAGSLRKKQATETSDLPKSGDVILTG